MNCILTARAGSSPPHDAGDVKTHRFTTEGELMMRRTVAGCSLIGHDCVRFWGPADAFVLSGRPNTAGAKRISAVRSAEQFRRASAGPVFNRGPGAGPRSRASLPGRLRGHIMGEGHNVSKHDDAVGLRP
jgi:hypothetical protein